MKSFNSLNASEKTSSYTEGMLKSCCYQSIRKLPRKTSLVAFLLQNSSCLIYPPISIQKTDSPQLFPLFVPRIFKINRRASCGGITFH